ncbi:hypothetical protein AAMO2058_000629000 [Amorphochlora amoebiformis]|mmetsp:Transcript_23024/g.36177  ORF Transcript_23024/g.36177 Transcript_23024/m.36177 type:complete len:299 (-) Transcript_23024:186-1082(-)
MASLLRLLALRSRLRAISGRRIAYHFQRNPMRNFCTGENKVKEEKSKSKEEKSNTTEETKGKEEGKEAKEEMTGFAVRDLVAYAIYFALGYLTWGAYKFATEVPPGATIAMNLAEKHDKVIQEVGVPLSLSYLWGGRSTSNELVATLPVYGPKGKATLRVRAVRVAEGWKILMLDCITEKDKFSPFEISISEANKLEPEQEPVTATAEAPAPFGFSFNFASTDLTTLSYITASLSGYNGESEEQLQEKLYQACALRGYIDDFDETSYSDGFERHDQARERIVCSDIGTSGACMLNPIE